MTKTHRYYLFHAIVLTILIIWDSEIYLWFHSVIDWIDTNRIFLLTELIRHRHWRFFEQMGNIWAAIIAIYLIAKFDKPKYKYIQILILSIIVTTLAYTVLKHTVGKIRPNVHDGIVVYHPFLQGWFTSRNLSFPSGHTTFAFTLATFLSLLYPQCKKGFYGLALCCGISRVFFEAHFFADVYLGAFLGYEITRFLYARIQDKKLVVVFSSEPNTSLLTFKLIPKKPN
jgi:undecaprenyl-diphosphatase